MKQPYLIALGGNALQSPDSDGSFESQYRAAYDHLEVIARLAQDGHPLVLTHGNGPQSGALLLQQEAGKDVTTPQPLHSLVAMTQGQLGYTLELALRNRLTNVGVTVGAVITLVAVDPNDPAFATPTKPVGPFYTQEQVAAFTDGNVYKEDAGRGYRRVVASPKPQAIVATESMKPLVQPGHIMIAGGGGGVPVIRKNNTYEGIDAVIDKDYTSMLLAESLGIDQVIILTGVPEVYVDFGTAEQRALRSITVQEAQQHLKDGQFGSGSMEPKVRAGMEFVQAGADRQVIITSAEHLESALKSNAGTRISSSQSL